MADTNTTSAGLLPCPFCGGEALLENTITQASIMCCNCPAVMRRDHTTRSFDDGTHRAIAAWNTRQSAAPASEAGEVERVALAIRDVKGGVNYDYMDFCRDAARAAIEALSRPSADADAVELLRSWRSNLAITRGAPIAGDPLHGPALDFVIEQIDGLLAALTNIRKITGGGDAE